MEEQATNQLQGGVSITTPSLQNGKVAASITSKLIFWTETRLLIALARKQAVGTCEEISEAKRLLHVVSKLFQECADKL